MWRGDVKWRFPDAGHGTGLIYVEEKSWRFAHFRPEEMACTATGELAVTFALMHALEMLRGSIGEPLIVTSGYRSPEFNASIGGHQAHPMGIAVDLAVHGEKAYRVLKEAPKCGFSGIGVSQKGPMSERFAHLDVGSRVSKLRVVRPTVFSY